jgi:hypothetical protein
MDTDVLIDVLECEDTPIKGAGNIKVVDGISDKEMEKFFSKIDLTSDPELLELSSEETDITLSLRIDSFADAKELAKFVKSCEFMIRKSVEYRLWILYIKETLGLVKCEITGEYSNQTSIEIHHHPITLYHIVEAVIAEKIAKEESFCTFDIAMDVIKLHFENKLGFVPLVETLHSKYHNGFLEIPMELVSGNYQFLIDNYLKYLDEKTKEYIIGKTKINRSNCGWNVTWKKDNYPAPRLQDLVEQDKKEKEAEG